MICPTLLEISGQSDGVLKGLPGDGVGSIEGLEGFRMSEANELSDEAELLRLTKLKMICVAKVDRLLINYNLQLLDTGFP